MRVEGLNRAVERLRKAVWPDLLCLAAGHLLVFAWIWPELHNATETWHALGAAGQQSLKAPGAWEVLVAVPRLIYWWLRWIWKIGL
jgi:hypothetical protein